METTYLPNMTINDGKVEMIYKCSWFETKKHKKSHTNMYFLKAEHCGWVFGSDDYHNGLSRVELIPVLTCTVAYQAAVDCSKIQDECIKESKEKHQMEKEDKKKCYFCKSDDIYEEFEDDYFCKDCFEDMVEECSK